MEKTMINKQYILDNMDERIQILEDRYRMYCKSEDEAGMPLSYGTAAVYRSNTKRDLALCTLLYELVSYIKKDDLELSKMAEDGLDKVMEPLERHRRLLMNNGIV
jgi:hypothetical protein